MNKIIVLKLEGKGDSGADFASIHTFDDSTSGDIEANLFIQANTDLTKKYWSVATVVKPGERLETYKEAF